MTKHKAARLWQGRCIVALLLTVSAFAQQQPQLSKFDRERAQGMLQVVANEVRKHYYDPKFHGVDWDKVVQDEKDKIEKSNSFGMAMSHIAAGLDTLNDSHTFFLPPGHAVRLDYGLNYQMIADHCFVVQVRPGSDAETKGVKPGDEILAINGYAPSRANLWKMNYVFTVLRPQNGLHFVLQSPGAKERDLDVMAKMRQLRQVQDLTHGGDIWDLIRDDENQRHMMRAQFEDMGDDLIILKFPIFDFANSQIVDLIGRVRKHKAFILDLRSNPGGSVETLKWFLGGLFENDVKVGDRVRREDTKEMTAKRSHDPFTGKLVVLVDSQSASAAEVFARVVQIEKRGKVLGDRSSGSVMESLRYQYHSGTEIMVFYGASITEADLVMTDGKSLEHIGVTPDETVVPTGQDLASGRDPVLSRAAELVGVKLSPEQAGKLFPFEWLPQ